MKPDATKVAQWWKDYEAGKSLRQIQVDHKVGSLTLIAAFREHGHKARTASEAMRVSHSSDERRPKKQKKPVLDVINGHQETQGACMESPVSCAGAQCRYWLEGGECAMRLANTGSMSQVEIAPLLGVTRQRIEQIERKALIKLRVALRMKVGPGACDALMPVDPVLRAKECR